MPYRPASRANSTLLLVLVAAGCSASAPEPASERVPLGTAFELHSTVLDEDRRIVVSLPEGYEEGGAHYPVLYMLDGEQNQRHATGSAEVLARTGHVPPVIVVGIESENRMRDFTPSGVDEVPYSGGADRFLEFMAEEVMPFVEARYRTHPFRVLEGHSLGGTFTTHTLLERPDLFDAYIIVSPAFWWDDEVMSRRAETFFETRPVLDEAVYFGIGMDDGEGMKNELARFVDVLRRHESDGLRWEHRVMEAEGHMSAPLLVNYYGLRFVFADMGLPERLWSAYDDAAFRAHEAGIMEKYGKAAKQSGEAYITLGLKLMEEEDYEGAITVFERNAEVYPVFPPNYAWLADAYEANGEPREALAAYREALERSRAINYGLEEDYVDEIERLEERTSSAPEPSADSAPPVTSSPVLAATGCPAELRRSRRSIRRPSSPSGHQAGPTWCSIMNGCCWVS